MSKLYKTKEGRIIEPGDTVEIRVSERILKYLASLGLIQEISQDELKKLYNEQFFDYSSFVKDFINIF